jgi:polyisoprenoid-binding protein YceI
MMNLTLLLVTLAIGDGADQKNTYTVNTTESTIQWFGGNVVGKTHEGTLTFGPSTLEVSGGKVTGGNLSVDMNSMTNTDLSGGMADKLVGHLKSDDFFSVESFPTAGLVIKKIGKGDNGAAQITASLTIKGKTEEVTFPAVVKIDGDNLMASAELTFDRSKFDVRYGSDSFFDNLGDKAIKNEIKVAVNVKATKGTGI